MATRVMVMAGGTGGHVFPALAVAQALRARGWDVSWLGTPDSFESRTVPQYDIPLDTIDAYRIRGQGVVGRLLAPVRLFRAMLQAFKVMRVRRPQVVLGMGGFAAGPGGLVSRILGLPLVIHEQNAVPGLTNRWLAKLATRVLQAFPDSFDADRGAETTGNPVRQDITELAAPEQRFSGRSGNCRLLVLGGSLGAQALNEQVPGALALLPGQQRPEIIHQAGRGKDDSTRSAYRAAGVDATVNEFLDDMAAAYAWADLVICRAGALTISELAATGVAAVLVPFPFAVDDHQTKNAQFLTSHGAALLLPQGELTRQGLSELLSQLCGERDSLLNRARAARALACPLATERVADVCQEVAA